MSVLTKVFVVLVTLLSILLVALIVPYVANTENYHEQAVQANNSYKAAQSDAQLKQTLLDQVRAKEADMVKDLDAARAILENQLTSTKEQLAKAETDLLDARAAKAKTESDITRLASAELQHAEISKAQEEELKQRRASVATLNTQIIQLADRNKEIESQLQAADRQHKRDAEQLVQLQEENGKIQTTLQNVPPEFRGGSAGTSAAAPFEPATPIQGKVTRVAKVEGDTFVEINVGKNDGVQPNMRFLIHRGDQYLGSLVISYVDANAASGRMSLEKGPIAAGDLALTGGH